MTSFNMPILRMRHIAIIAVLLLSAVFSASAQRGDDDGDGGSVREKIKRFKMARLAEVLDMDEATAEKFFVRYNLAQNTIRTAQCSLDSVVKDLEKAVADKNSKRIRELTEVSLKRHTALQEAIAEMFRSVRPVLSEDQYAKFIIFEARFPKEMKKRLKEMRKNRGDDHMRELRRDNDDD